MTIDANNWSGVLTADNLEEVAQAIAQRLEDKHYTFVEEKKYVVNPRKEHRDLILVREGVSTWTSGFTIHDTYGDWHIETKDNPRIILGQTGIVISQSPGTGKTKWTIIPE
ncbi:MAG TPA: hypothetical protein VH593_06465 [Ktedonobacteraceae bacterium]|jgi:hypothetical protein